MNPKKELGQKRERRKLRNRAAIFGTAKRPRLSVFRSNRSIQAQLIDDEKGKTLVSASSKNLTPADKKKKKSDQARLVGGLLAKKAVEAGINRAVFDRGKYRYHGRVLSFAEGVREGGLKI